MKIRNFDTVSRAGRPGHPGPILSAWPQWAGTEWWLLSVSPQPPPLAVVGLAPVRRSAVSGLRGCSLGFSVMGRLAG